MSTISIQSPWVCLLCSQPADSSYLCPCCQTRLSQWQGVDRCQFCGLQGQGHCQGHGCPQYLGYQRMTVVSSYGGQVAWLVRQLKYHRQWPASRALAWLCQQALRSQYQGIDAGLPPQLLPMPMHWLRRMRRGFNHSQLIAQQLAAHTGQKVNDNLVVRKRATKPLEKLTGPQRQLQLQGAFTCRQEPQARLLVVDDVLTSGASLRSLARTLKRHGHSQLHALVTCRTEK